jgi:hypothetical protein
VRTNVCLDGFTDWLAEVIRACPQLNCDGQLERTPREDSPGCTTYQCFTCGSTYDDHDDEEIEA